MKQKIPSQFPKKDLKKFQEKISMKILDQISF